MSGNAFLVSLFEHKAWCNTGLAGALRAGRDGMEPMAWAVALLTFEHTHRVDRVFKARLEGTAPGVTAVVGDAVPDLDALARRMAAMDAWYVDYAARVTQAELAGIVAFTYLSDGEPGRMTRGDILGHVITHGASHRGAIGKMLEPLGVAGAPDMMTTFRRPA
ncbi:MAG: DinB family protein [Rhizomicrobium sp.]